MWSLISINGECLYLKELAEVLDVICSELYDVLLGQTSTFCLVGNQRLQDLQNENKINGLFQSTLEMSKCWTKEFPAHPDAVNDDH